MMFASYSLANELYLLEIKGKDIKPLINGAINGHGGLPMFSGLDVEYKDRQRFKVHSLIRSKTVNL